MSEPGAEDNAGDPQLPEAEELIPQTGASSEESTDKAEDGKDPKDKKPAERPKHSTYRPSHKATFIGAGVVAVILIVNVVVIAFFVNNFNNENAKKTQDEVTLSPAVLETLGVSRNPVGTTGVELIVSPNAKFNGKVTIASDVSIAGNFKLNSKFLVNDASIAKLEAGNVSLTQLNVNGDATATNLILRKDLTVPGTSRLQGPTVMSQLLTVNNNVNVSGSMSVGGTLTVRTFQASNLVSDTTLTIGGHIITGGAAPAFAPGNALGSSGTASNSGNDASGTVAANVGSGAVPGIIGVINFRNKYNKTPHVVVTAVGSGVGSFYVVRGSTGFSIGVNTALAPGSYAFDYIVME